MKILSLRNRRLTIDGIPYELTYRETMALAFLSNNNIVTYDDFLKYLKIKNRHNLYGYITRLKAIKPLKDQIKCLNGHGYIMRHEVIYIDY